MVNPNKISVAADIRVQCFNARSICNKLNELSLLLTSGEVDVVGITETWLSSDFPDALLSGSGNFQVFRSDRSCGMHGGGVCLLVSNRLRAICVPGCPAEVIAVDVALAEICYRIVCVYRAPSLGLEDLTLLTGTMESLLSVQWPVFIMGDLNLPEIQWNQLMRPSDTVSATFLDFCLQQALEQIVLYPTRGSNILDIILCSDTTPVLRCSVADPFANSDHATVCFELAGALIQTEQVRSFKDFKHADFESMSAYLLSVDWAVLFGHCSSVTDMYSVLYEHLRYAVDQFVPIVPCRGHQILPLHLRKLRSRKRRLFRRRCAGSGEAKYRSCAALYRRKVRNYFVKREKSIIESNSASGLYKFVRQKLKQRPCIPTLRTGSSFISEDRGKAMSFNSQFASVFTQDDGLLPEMPEKNFDCALSDIDCSPFRIAKVMKELPPKCSCGPDEIPPLLYKRCADSLSFPLSCLFKKSMSSGELPPVWKCAFITPVFKNGDKTAVENYRPISVTCAICLIFERLIKADLMSHLNRNGLLTDQQFGFRAKRSVEAQLLLCLDKWTSAVDSGLCIDILYLDFKRAFDTVSHPKLIHKLYSYGIRGHLLSWLKCYLSDRLQIVKVGDSCSDAIPVSSGVPQGTVLGPVLFLLYLNDLVDELPDVEIYLYADDAKLFKIFSPTSTFLPPLASSLLRLEHWATRWQLNLAIQKCKIVHIGQRNAKFLYAISGVTLESVQVIRDLGVLISSDLKWFPHVAQIVSKAAQRSKLILKCFTYSNLHVLSRAFTVYVRPLLENCASVWNPYLEKDVKLIESVQRQFSRRLFHKCGLEQSSYENRLSLLGLQPLSVRRTISDLCMVFSVFKCTTDFGASPFLHFVPNVQNLRGNSQRLIGRVSNVNARKNFFSNRVVNLWNSLIINPLSFNSVTAFRRYLNSYFSCV